MPVPRSSASAVFSRVAGVATVATIAACSTTAPSDGGAGARSREGLAAVPGAGDASPVLAPERTITLLHTADLHTNVLPWDYFAGAPDPNRGLAKVATLVRQERKRDCTLLVDTGDVIQGTPLGTYYALRDPAPMNPMAVAMNALGYDAMVLGNHEFDFGLPVVDKFVGEARFPVLGANVRRADGSEAYGSTILRDVCGVRVGILGLVTPGVPVFERPENLAGLTFADPVETAKAYVPRLRAAGADVVVVAFHAGPDRQPPGNPNDPTIWLTDYETWTDRGNVPGENEAVQLAREVPGVDAILSGHTHEPIPKMVVNGVVIEQPGRWGDHLGEVTLGLERTNGAYAVVAKDSRLLAVDATVPADPATVALVQGYHDATIAYVAQPIGHAAAPFVGGPAARVGDGALAGLVDRVEIEAAAAAGFPVDLAASALTTDDGALRAGTVTLRDVFGVYPFDNTIDVLAIDGGILREALEQDATYFARLDPAALPASFAASKAAPVGPDYNWDLYASSTPGDLAYVLDLTRPAGDRVTSLTWRGAPVAANQPFRIALNNYRGGGGGAFAMFKRGTVVWRSADNIRDLLVGYVGAHPELDPKAYRNCAPRLVPDLYAPYFAETLGPSSCAR